METEQRLEKQELYIHCNCGSPIDYLYMFWWSEDNWGHKSFSVSLISQPRTLWERIKRGFGFMFSSEDYMYWDIGITESDMVKIEKIFKEYKESK